jgi:hypothetical protein
MVSVFFLPEQCRKLCSYPQKHRESNRAVTPGTMTLHEKRVAGKSPGGEPRLANFEIMYLPGEVCQEHFVNCQQFFHK